MQSAITISNLKKSYNGTEALKGISLEISKGEIFGFIGPDGSGKTTLFRILTTLLLPDEGEAIVLENDVVKDYKQIRKIIGYMPERFSLYQDLTVEENLRFFASIFRSSVEENYHLVKDIFSLLEPFRKRRAGKLSGGMKQKLALSCALIHKPEVLVLDEPTTGVDAVSRKEFWGMLKKLEDQGITILVSTPYMDEAGLCDRVALIQQGEILGVDTPKGITASFPYPLFAVKADDMHRLPDDLGYFPGFHSVYRFGEFLHLSVSGGEKAMEGLTEFLRKKGHHGINVKKIEPGIEDSFMELMHKERV